MMIPETHKAETFHEYVDRGNDLLRDLERRSRDGDVPIVGSHLGNLLYLLVKVTRAKHILELGTANGYSTIWLSMALKENLNLYSQERGDNFGTGGGRGNEENGGGIISIEWEQDRLEEAERNLSQAGYRSLVDLRQGDARMVTDSLKGKSFDLIFIDVEKEYYSELLDPAVDLLMSGGLLVFDNTAFVTAGDFRERSSNHPLLYTVHNYGFLPNHEPEYDAVTLCVKK